MITAELICAVLVVLIPFLVPLNIIWLYIIVMLTSAIGQFFDPAHESVLPEVASDGNRPPPTVNGDNSFGSTAVGFAAAGLIASAANINWAFYIDAATFIASALCIYLISIKPFSVEDETSVSIVLNNLRAGVHQLFNTPIFAPYSRRQVPVFIALG